MAQPSTKSSEKTQRLHPGGLAKALDLWALRREKLLPLLDVRAAREARRLAQGCRRLASTERTGEVPTAVWESEWRAIREQAVALLDGSGRTTPVPTTPIPHADDHGSVTSSVPEQTRTRVPRQDT
jgi:hypothetical protein